MRYLLSHVPPHHTYVEAFGGGAALLFAKEPAPVEVYNDIDDGLVNFFTVLRDRFDDFQRLCLLTPYARSVFDDFKDSWDNEADPVRRAHRWFVVARQSFSGNFGSGWCSVLQDHWRGVAGSVASYLSAVERLPEVHLRLLCCQVEKMDFRKLLPRYDGPEAFFFLDPPYVHATRKSHRYAHEMSDADHGDLVDILTTLKGRVMLCGYENELYARLGWERLERATSNFAVARSRAVARGGKAPARVEVVWKNF